MVAQGTTLAGRYRLDTRIGAGGMGEVWRGEDVVLARTVAVKVLLPGRMDDPGFVARFQGEARAMATINHSGVVDVYDYGVSGDTVYLVMKFVDGEPLDRLLARLGRIPPQAAMELIAQAAAALQAVHEQGIVHRDVKPGNLLVQRDGTLVLTDFGIARSDLANRLTDAGMVLGTAAYCAPEQAEGAPVTPAVDIYALGVVAYECLAGQRPFDGDSAVTIALKHIREAPPPLPADIPPAVRALVECALSKDPARRFPTAKAMSETARQIANGQTPALPGPTPHVTGATMAAPTHPGPTGAPPAAGHPTGAHPQDGYQTGAHQSGYQTGAQQAGYPAGAQPGGYQTGAHQAGAHQGGYQAGAHHSDGYPQTGAHESQQPPQGGGQRTGGFQAQDATTVAHPRQGRRGGKAPRRGGLIAGIAAAVVLGAGAGAVALTGLNTVDDPPVPTATAAKAGSETSDTPKATKTKPTRTPKSRPSTHEPVPTRETETEEPAATEEPTREPTRSPTPTPSTTKKTPTPTPTPAVTRRAVPHVVEMPYPQARAAIQNAGFTVKYDDQTRGAVPLDCLRVGESIPEAGTQLALKKPVTLVLIEGGTCPSGSPTPTGATSPYKN
ncbi:serine/threonine protein kinase [Nonomuraea roseoviolacea]|uniref:non-specific serine/threonine protein kinase n=1 Tax=Nonomuraea roseoviolacea subsp. carminata TaxID=160689 RepID=A0ABT1K4V4_9ACTN|nr:serine/threonine protein kinase [Nonomuraea roseoviolacea]MCP2348622.1 serine/threonine-protein kinase [Nonomuraea roseoviolacea subsp. carminata]